MNGDEHTPRQKGDPRDAWRKTTLFAGAVAALAMLLIALLQLMALVL